MSAPLTLAVVGYGMTALSHGRTFAADGHHLRWLVGRVPERTEAFAREHGYERQSTSLEEALGDPAVDAIILCTPSDQHEAQAIACLDAGKHVLVEIPVAMSLAGARRVAAKARESGRVAMVAHTHRYHPGVRLAKSEIEAGTLTPHSITSRYMFLRRENVGASGYKRSWTDNLLWHHGCHAVDTALWLVGAVFGAVETTSIVSLPDAHLATPLDLALVLRTASDRLVSVSMSYNSHLSRYDYVVVGHEDTLEIRDGVLRERHATGPIEAARDSGPSPVVRQDREFADAIREGRSAAISPDDVLPAMEVLQIAQDAADAVGAAALTHQAAGIHSG
jgi:2-hydroxy-4-carboxymuconate semialdehyde hemiacetal dehydrogenase